MLARLTHRGPDGEGRWVDPAQHVALGHTRLAIVDTSDAGRQPLHLEHLHAVVNGEIYNYPELRRELEQKCGAVFQSHCDSEVVLHGYRYYGEDFFARLNGMFAFALYDAAEHRLLLVRDPAGIKPLYYCQRPEGVFFASEIKGLLAALDVTRWPIDLLGLSQYLSYQTALGARTLFEGVSLLLPGCLLDIRTDSLPQQISARAYAPLPPATNSDLSFPEALAAFDATFAASVRRHLLSDVPVASYISAGFDSASVAVEAAHAQAAKGPMTAFTGRFSEEDGWYDETTVAGEAVHSFDGRHVAVDIRAQDFVAHLDDVIDALDEPKMGMGAFSQFMVAKTVATQFKVILTGHGGDELFAGYPLFKLARLRTLCYLKRSELPHLVYFILSSLRRWWQPEYGRQLPVLWSRKAQEKLLGRGLGGLKPWQPLAALQAACPDRGARITATYLHHYLPGLLVVEDKISMAHRLESRTPFLDHALLELSAKIPTQVKLHHGELKALIKARAKNHLPASYFTQPKRGFPTPLRHWLRGPLTEFMQARLLGADSALPRLFEREAIARTVHRYLHSPYRFLRPLDEIQSHRIWQLLSLESWLRQWQTRYGITLELR
jgi:asparagine synthase (glutamine-hydrolysing)